MKAYYEQRAPEYDDWWLGTGRFQERDRPGWHEEVGALAAAPGALAPARTLDVACGTGFLTRHLPGTLTGLDQSPAVLAIARERIAGGAVVVGDGLELPFADGAFERVATGHFYGHLEPPGRARFLAEARRVAGELLVIDSARRDDVPSERLDPRVLNDGSRHVVFKRWFEPQQLVDELGGGEVVHAGTWFVAVRALARRFGGSGQQAGWVRCVGGGASLRAASPNCAGEGEGLGCGWRGRAVLRAVPLNCAR